ncbi:RDD family protein [Vitreoscilla massiliensis]|uniref:RDD family protein n=1 Tax=Vitreoscilla massiliensis TaxID=1689272 RepID=A0ABY4E1Z8_9NEIS|nr:RDD family protein [Vitreoscilla massiliensis]UOO88815.1 RDD family protein [Vitreoscilla massiliensis]
MSTATEPALLKRFCALVYEGLIFLAVTIVAIIVALPLSYALKSMPALQQLCLSLWFVAAWWLYAKLNWKKGQTLAMKVWHMQLANEHGHTPPLPQLRMRFLWAVLFLVLVPALSYLVLSHVSPLPPKPRFYLSLVWWLLPWGFACFHPSKQFLYDVLAGTRITLKPAQSKT